MEGIASSTLIPFSINYASSDINNNNQLFFDQLGTLGLYTDSEVDKIALLYVYFPLIREEIYNFVHIWNNHRIRSQKKKRPNLPTGKPSVLYFTPPDGTSNYGVIPDANLLNILTAEVAAWGIYTLSILELLYNSLLAQFYLACWKSTDRTHYILNLDPDEYLPAVTINWCQRRLQGLGVSSGPGAFTLEELTLNGTPKHAAIYIQLRTILQDEVFGPGFQLPRCHPPTGEYNWTPAISDYTSSVSTLTLIGEEVIDELDS